MNRSGRRGSSLAELLVSLSLLGAVTWAAWGMVDDAGRAVGWAGKTAMAATAEPALALFRKDAERSVGRPKGAASSDGSGDVADGWSTGPLELLLDSGATVRWSLERQRVVRTQVGADGVTSRRNVAGPVLSLRWKRPGEGVVVMELTSDAPPRGWFRSRKSLGKRPEIPEKRVDLAWVAARRSGTEGSW